MQVLTMPTDHRELRGSEYAHHPWMMPVGGQYSPLGSVPSSISPMQEYPHYDFHTSPPPPPPAPTPVEPSYRMSRPPPYAAGVQQMPAPLVMPQSGLWPSMIASGVHAVHYQPTALASAPVMTPLSAGTGSDMTPTSAKTSTSRRKLTDDERRQMCLEAEQNPTMKQTQIGAKFNVERSTVSKILRQKDKYMNLPTHEEVVSPGKKSKTKLPDFEKTLANWVRNQQKKGLSVSNEDLKKQARFFSFSRDDQALVSSSTWLKKFQQKNQLGSYNTESATDSTKSSLATTPPINSPAPSNDVKLPFLTKAEMASPDEHFEEGYFDFESKSSKDFHSQLASPFSDKNLGEDDMVTELPPTHIFPPTSNQSMHRSSHAANAVGNHTRPLHHSATTAPDMALQLSRALTTTSLTTESHVDPSVTVKRHKSVPDIHDEFTDGNELHFATLSPPPLPSHSESVSPNLSPMSPAEDANIKALHEIKKLLQDNPGVADPDDYLAIGKLMEKMKVLRGPASSAASLRAQDVKGRKRQFLGIS